MQVQSKLQPFAWYVHVEPLVEQTPPSWQGPHTAPEQAHVPASHAQGFPHVSLHVVPCGALHAAPSETPPVGHAKQGGPAGAPHSHMPVEQTQNSVGQLGSP